MNNLGTNYVKLNKRRGLALAILSVIIAFTLCACRVEPDKLHPTETVYEASTASPTGDSNLAPTDEPYSAPTVEPTASPTIVPVSETPISFQDINFENAVRDAIGRMAGSIYPSDLQNIKSFTARVSGIVNIREITYFTSLEELDLMGNRISDLTPLTSLKNLKKINIAKNFSVMTGDREKGLDISPLGSLPLLETLDASNDLITDISALGSLKMLKWLDISTNRLVNLDGIEGLVSLEYLNISNSFHSDKDNNPAGITDISPLSALVNLKTLYMQNGRVNSLEPLTSLTQLEYIDASYNSVRMLPDMKPMTGLKTLVLKSNFITGLAGLSGQQSVEVLDVRDNYITMINEILMMRSLETVYLDGNPILSYIPLDLFNSLKNNPYNPPLPVPVQNQELQKE